MPNCSVRASKQVFTVYVGLTASGYDMARPGRNKAVRRLVRAIRETAWPEEVVTYFRRARTGGCAVNPYWPRAFLLTLASLYLPESPPYRYADPDLISRHIQNLDAVSPADKGPDTLRWVLDLPGVYETLWAQPVLQALWNLYEASINPPQCERAASEAVSTILERTGASPGQLPCIVILPNPLQAPELTDSVILGGKLHLIKANPDAASCIHEILHHLLSPAIWQSRPIVDEFSYLLEPVRADMLRMGYAWDNAKESWRRVFEEHLMRAAEIWMTCGDDPGSAERAAASQARYGFKYVPAILGCLQSSWSGIAEVESFIIRCLRACRERVTPAD